MNALPNLPWPLCLTCGKEYVPIPTLQGCPWCSGARQYHDPTEDWRTRYNRHRREQRAELRALGRPTT